MPIPPSSLLFLLLLLLFRIPEEIMTLNMESLCNSPTAEEEYIVPHPTDCRRFISCARNTKPVEWQCNEGYGWVREHCDLPNPGDELLNVLIEHLLRNLKLPIFLSMKGD